MQIIGYLSVPEGVIAPTLQDKTVTVTATETAQTETLEKDLGYDGLGEVTINVNAIPSDYVGSGVTQRTSSDLAASGATVTAPAGYYENQATKSVASGTEGTPTATKGNVSNHSVSVTPSVTNSEGYISGGTHAGTAVTVSADELVSGSQTIEENDTYDVTNLASVTVNVPTGSTINNQDKSVTPTESAQSVTYDSGYTGLGTVSVGAISSSYVGTGITRRDSDDLSASGATVTAPAGYYGSSASKTIASGTEGTPTASKGSVSNHAISVTPSVTNSAGYIAGGTHSGTAVSVSASELVSGTLTVDSSGTKDVTNYASASVPAGTAGTPAATKGTVSNHSVTVTPSVTNSAGWVSSETKTGTAVTVQASELDSGTKSITANGTNQDVVGYAAVDVAVPNSYSAGDEGKVVSSGALVSQTSDTVTQNGTVDTTLINSLTVSVSGGVDTELKSYLERTATTVDNSSLTSLGASSFRAYSGLTSAIFRNVTTCGGQTFYASTSLTTLELPSLTAVPNEMCRGCTSLTSVSIPNASGTLKDAAFRETKLTVFVVPSGITIINTLALGQITTLTTIDVNNVTSLGNSSFQNSTNLNLLVIRSSTRPISIASSNVIQGTKFANGGAGGDIYIPKSLYDHLGDDSNMDYKKATNWSTIDGYGTITWHAIEGSYYETHYADGTLIPTT